MLVNSIISSYKNTNRYNNIAKGCTDLKVFENSNINLNYSPLAVNNISFMAKINCSPTKLERFEGCLFGGAIGDAMGAKVEACSIDKIREKYGKSGLKYIVKNQGKYRFTDDTQMSLFTLEGLIKSYIRTRDLSSEPNYADIFDSYKRWYSTQTNNFDDFTEKSGLMSEKELYVRRGPGKTCINSIAGRKMGTVKEPINNSPTNGGIMRIAPVGLMYCDQPDLAFKIGTEVAAMTHGNADAYLPAGFLAGLIANLVNGLSIEKSINHTINELKKYDGCENTLQCINKAIKLSSSDIPPEEAIGNIGLGFLGNEALGIALYCVLKEPKNYKKAIILATNHNGDSDTTAEITGSIMGALLGSDKIPRGWIDNIELCHWFKRYAGIVDNIVKDKHYTNEIITRRDDDRLTLIS